jgi:predicted dehydrogenase
MSRLAVIGYGARSAWMVKCLQNAMPDLCVCAVIDPNEDQARSRMPEKDRESVLFFKDVPSLFRAAKPDAVLIGTRCNLHTPYAIQVARYPVALFLEKPVAISMKQTIALERAFEKSKCRVVVSFPLRVSPLCILGRERIETGAVGRPEHILAVNYVPYGTCYFDGGYRDYAVTQGLFLQKATHDLDYMSFLMGSAITRVAATALKGRVFGGRKKAGLTCSTCKESADCLESPSNRKCNLSGGTTEDHPCVFGTDIGTPESGMNEDCSSVLVEFASGAQGVYTQVFFTRRDAAARGATVSGYHGTLSFDWYTNQMKHVRHHRPFSDVTTGGSGLSHFGGDQELALDFAAAIQGSGHSRTPIETGIQSAYACLAAKISSETGRFVRVRQVGQVA